MSTWLRDIRYSLRMLRKAPEVTLVVVVAMALAIGATSTVFSVINGTLIRPLPFAEADRLAGIWQIDTSQPQIWRRAALADFADIRRSSTSFETLGAAVNRSFTLTGFEQPETPLMRQASDGYFETLGVEPFLGRLFSVEECRPGGDPVVLLSHGLWQRRFGADPQVLGQVTELDGEPHTIIGVMPPDFDNPVFGLDVLPQAWVPLVLAESGLDRRSSTYLIAGRLAEGVSFEQAKNEVEKISRDLAAQYPATNENRLALVTPLAENIARGVRPAMLLLFGAVAVVLLVACGNAANLLLTRALGRQREMAVRRALGASTSRLGRQLVTENLVLMLLAGSLGLVLAAWGSGSLHHLMPEGPGIPALDLEVDRTVVLFTFGLSLVTGLGFGLVPIAHAVRSNLGTGLGVAALRATTGRRSQRLRNVLVVAEVALSLVLLVGAGLMVRSFVGLQALDPGFEQDDLLVFRVSTRGPGYDEPAKRAEFFQQVAESIATLPGVESAGAAQGNPVFTGFLNQPIYVGGQPIPEPGSEPRALLRRLTPGYLETLGVPLLQGRLLTTGDDADGPMSAIISRTGAQQLWGDGDPISQTVTVLDGDRRNTWQIVGVVGDIRSDLSPPEPQSILYVPMAQDPDLPSAGFAVRVSSGNPLARLEEVKQRVWAVDPAMPVYQVRTMRDTLELIDWQSGFLMTLLGLFALLGLGLAATGIYGVLSFAVSRRLREIGIRMALGARRADVVAMILRGAATLAGIGIGLGLLGALAFGQLLSSQLFGITATDPLTFGGLTLVLALVALLAGLVPALKATRVDPASTLHQE